MISGPIPRYGIFFEQLYYMEKKTYPLEKSKKNQATSRGNFFCTFLPLFYEKLFVANCLRKNLKISKHAARYR